MEIPGTERAKREDPRWNMEARADLSRYTPIVAVETAGTRIGIASDDGRISLWRLGISPVALPGTTPWPDFQAIARLDHDQRFTTPTLMGAVGIKEPPFLVLSPSGRLGASQSLGIRFFPSNGLIEGWNPLLRVWNFRHEEELARLQLPGGAIVAFSPDDKVMTSVVGLRELPPPSQMFPKHQTELQFWSLRNGPTQDLIRRLARFLPAVESSLEPWAKTDGVPVSFPWMPVGSSRLWLGRDQNLRVGNGEEGQVIEDLRPQLAAAARWMSDAGARTEEKGSGALRGETASPGDRTASGSAPSPDDSKSDKSDPTPAFGLVGAISGDRRRAAVGVGKIVRLYDLDGTPRLFKAYDLSSYMSGAQPIMDIALSRDGAYWATSVINAGNSNSADSRGRKLLVFRADSESPIHVRASDALADVSRPNGFPGEPVVAVSSDGRFVVVDVSPLRVQS